MQTDALRLISGKIGDGYRIFAVNYAPLFRHAADNQRRMVMIMITTSISTFVISSISFILAFLISFKRDDRVRKTG